MQTNTRSSAITSSQIVAELRRLKPQSPVLQHFTLEPAAAGAPIGATQAPLSPARCAARSSTNAPCKVCRLEVVLKCPRANCPHRAPLPTSGAELVDDARAELEESDDGACTNPAGHSWVYTGTSYGGEDDSYHGEGRCYCEHCGADGDA